MPIRCRQGEQPACCSSRNKGTQGREMNRKFRIASALTLVGMALSFPAAASAGSPLLSGYGGPGAGEQAIVGSTLVGGPRGGAGSGGSSGSSGSTVGASEAAGSSPSGSASTGSGSSPISRSTARAGAGRSSSTRSGAPSGSGRRRGGEKAVTRPVRAGTTAFVYPSSLRSQSTGSSAFGFSGGDLLLLLGIAAALALTGTFTMRLTRL